MLPNIARPGSALPALSGEGAVQHIPAGAEQVTVHKVKGGKLHGRAARLPRGAMVVCAAGWLQPERLRAAMVVVRLAMGQGDEEDGARESAVQEARCPALIDLSCGCGVVVWCGCVCDAVCVCVCDVCMMGA